MNWVINYTYDDLVQHDHVSTIITYALEVFGAIITVYPWHRSRGQDQDQNLSHWNSSSDGGDAGYAHGRSLHRHQ